MTSPSCLTQLINAGATILVDDTGFVSDDLMSLDNDQSSAVAQILRQHPDGHDASVRPATTMGTYWEGNYSPVSAGHHHPARPVLPTGAGTPDAYVAAFGSDTSQTLTVTGDNTFPLLLAWADPPGQITSQFDVFWFAPGSTDAARLLFQRRRHHQRDHAVRVTGAGHLHTGGRLTGYLSRGQVPEALGRR